MKQECKKLYYSNKHAAWEMMYSSLDYILIGTWWSSV